jgi:uncharacterized protein YkwD
MRSIKMLSVAGMLASMLLVGCGGGGTVVVPGDGITRSDIVAMINRHNNTRAQFGLPPLQESARLAEIADDQADWMANIEVLTHEDANEDRVDRRATLVGYDWGEIGENLARASSGSRAYELWLDSSEHLDNILDEDFEDIGVGAHEVGSTEYWCVVFGWEF